MDSQASFVVPRLDRREYCRRLLPFPADRADSADEAEYHFMRARDLDLLHEKDFRTLTREADELQRMLTALMQRIRSARSAQDQLEARNSQLSPSNLFPA